MKLQAIKNEILDILNAITLDDLYATTVSELVRGKFFELTGTASNEEISNYLYKRFPKTSAEMLSYQANLEISSLNSKIEEIKNSQQDAAGTVQQISNYISGKQRELNRSVETAERIKMQFLEIESEITLILPLAKKYPYSRELEDLRDSQAGMTLELVEKEAHQKKLEDSILDYRNKAKIEQELIAKLENEIEPKKSLIAKIKHDLEENINTNKDLFDLEYDALAFLYTLFLGKSIKKFAERGDTKTGRTIIDYRGESVEEKLYMETGKITLKTDKLEEGKYFQFVISLVNVKPMMPKNWRTILLDILAEPLPDLAGTIMQIKTPDDVAIVQKSLPLQSVDTATLLALTIALNHNYSLSTVTGDIILGMSGGISARINFRKKGELIRKEFDDKLQIFANCVHSDRFELQKLYEQTGYANSRIEILTPGAYTLFSGNHVIDIHFSPAPILFNDHTLVKFSPNISGLARLEDEEEEED